MRKYRECYQYTKRCKTKKCLRLHNREMKKGIAEVESSGRTDYQELRGLWKVFVSKVAGTQLLRGRSACMDSIETVQKEESVVSNCLSCLFVAAGG